MIRKRGARALAGGLIAIALLVSATTAFAASGKFSGKTSQQQMITFTISGGHVRHLQFHVYDTCPNGHVWRIHDFGFPAIEINNSKFDGRFKSKPRKASAEIKGTVKGKKITGKLTERRLIPREHQFCRGSATYTATHA
jgi:hypothetical protein